MHYLLKVASSLCIVVLALHLSEASNDTEELAHHERLFDDLMHRGSYNKHIRPAGHSTPVVVKLGMAITRIHKLDAGILELQAWLRKTWTDVRLRWDPAAYGNISNIRFPNDMIWKPDIVLYNSADTMLYKAHDAQAFVYSSGMVMLIPPVTIKAFCPTNKNDDDEVTCGMKFGSWVYSGHEIDLNHYDPAKVDTSHYIANANDEWEFVDSSVSKNTAYYSCCPEPYPDIVFKISLKRVKQKSSEPMKTTETANYGTVFLIILIPTMFLLPPESKEKITLGCGLLVTMAMLVSNGSFHSWSLVVFETNMILVSISILMSTLVLNAWHNSSAGRRLPPYLRKMTYLLARLSCIHCSQTPADDTIQMTNAETNDENEAPNNECHLLVKVVDRMLFVVFFAVTLTTQLVLTQ